MKIKIPPRSQQPQSQPQTIIVKEKPGLFMHTLNVGCGCVLIVAIIAVIIVIVTLIRASAANEDFQRNRAQAIERSRAQ